MTQYVTVKSDLACYTKRRSSDKWTHKELVEEVKRLQTDLEIVRNEYRARLQNLEALQRRTPRFGWRHGG